MIVTVTLNAALDRTVRVPNFQLGARHRADASLRLPGGKGVNIARALKRLGQPVIATGLAGGRVGHLHHRGADGGGDPQRLRPHRGRVAHQHGRHRPHQQPADRDQRVRARRSRPAELDVLLDKIRYLSKGADVFVLAGSLPRDVPSDFYERLLRELRRERDDHRGGRLRARRCARRSRPSRAS